MVNQILHAMITDPTNKNVRETRTEEDMIEGVRAKMLDAVRVRLQADVPVGIHLSGGIDSSVVAGMAKHLLENGEVRLGGSEDQRLRCLGIAFDGGSGYDESGENSEHILSFGKVRIPPAIDCDRRPARMFRWPPM